MPPSTTARCVKGRFARNIPKAIGRRSKGSKPFFIARYISTNEIQSIRQCFQVRAAKPDASQRLRIESRKVCNIKYITPLKILPNSN